MIKHKYLAGDDLSQSVSQYVAFNNARTNEATLFKRLLQELLHVSLTDYDKRPIGPGRRAFSIVEKIFCMCMKVYHNADLRKTESILKELKTLNYVDKVPSFKSLSRFFNDEELIEVLDALIYASSLPLASLEDTGAIDSTGFSEGRFEQWSKFKWGKFEGKERVWRKLHAFVGCKTNTIISAEVTKQNVHDVSMVERTIGNKTIWFNMDTFVADKAYLSRKVLSFVSELGMLPFIPFKKNNKRPKGYNAWGKMWHRFQNDKDKFLKRYHKRSNVETCFSMIKKRFGNNCFMNTQIAQENEIKIKVLCHNICVLIQEVFENDIHIDFLDCVAKTETVFLSQK